MRGLRPSFAVLAVVALVGCADDGGSTDATPSPSATSGATDVATTASTPTVAPTSPTTATTAPTTTPTTTAATTSTTTSITTTTQATTTTSTSPSTSSTVPTPTTTVDDTGGRDGFEPAPDELLPLTVVVPSGEFISAPGDLVVLRTDGDLEYLPNGLAPSPSNRADPIPLVDRPDPVPNPQEGPGPNVIDDVAGVVEGSFVYGDCCEPVSGNLYAAPASGSETGPIAVGFSPNLSPSGDLLAAANGMQLSIAAPATGAGRTLLLNDDPDEPFRQILDLEWIDADTLAAIGLEDDGLHLVVYDATTLATWSDTIALDAVADDGPVRFAGTTPDGLVGVVEPGPDVVDVRYFDVLARREVDDRRQSFPPSVERIEVDDDGLGQIWVDGTTLYHLAPGAFTADPIADGVLAGWFVEP